MSVKAFCLGVITAVLLLLAGERAYHTFTWAGQVNYEAKAAYSYLAQPVANDKSGKPITRAQVLDAFIAQAQRASNAANRPSPSNGKN
jgi:hypothetical protein